MADWHKLIAALAGFDDDDSAAILEKQKRKMEKKAAKKAAEEAKVAAESAANFAALQSKLGQGNWGDDEVNSCVRVLKNGGLGLGGVGGSETE